MIGSGRNKKPIIDLPGEFKEDSGGIRSGISPQRDDTNNPPYPQCVLYFTKPPNDILKKILKEFIHINITGKRTNIDHVYAVIYKLYFLHLIQKPAYKKNVQELMKKVSHDIIVTFNLFGNDDDSKNDSTILKPALIHPDYHEEVVYAPNSNITDSSILKEAKKIFKENSVNLRFNLTRSIKPDIQTVWSRIISYICGDEKLDSLDETLLFGDIAHVLRTGKYSDSNELKQLFFEKHRVSIQDEKIKDLAQIHHVSISCVFTGRGKKTKARIIRALLLAPDDVQEEEEDGDGEEYEDNEYYKEESNRIIMLLSDENIKRLRLDINAELQ